MKLPISDDIGEISDFIKNQNHTRRIYKTHMQYYSFRKCWCDLVSKFHIFYLVRDGKDAITSLYNFYKSRGKYKVKTIGDFMKDTPPDFESAYRVAIIKPDSVIKLWIYHIESWFMHNEITYIAYEDMVTKFSEIVKIISNKLNMEPSQELRRPDKNKNVIHPGPGIIGNYKNYFTEEDIKYFNDNTRETQRIMKVMREYAEQ